MLEQLSGFIIHLIAQTGTLGVFVLMALESALIPIPSEVTMPFSGFLVSKGQLSFVFVVLAGALGNTVGSLIAYGIGFYLEENVILSVISKYGKIILITSHEYQTSLKWLKKHGEIVVFASRLLPGVRTFISLPAGLSEMNVIKFSLYTFFGSLIWSLALTYIGYYLGTKWNMLEGYFRKFQLLVGIGLALLILLYINHKLKIVKF